MAASELARANVECRISEREAGSGEGVKRSGCWRHGGDIVFARGCASRASTSKAERAIASRTNAPEKIVQCLFLSHELRSGRGRLAVEVLYCSEQHE